MRALAPWTGMTLFKDEMERLVERFFEPRLERSGSGPRSSTSPRPKMRIW